MNSENLAFVKTQFADYLGLFERYLDETACLRGEGVPKSLNESMEYSLNAGGKRLRPVLCLAAAERCGASAQSALPMALGLEMVHTATLIHDDLPCMDNDDMRRGMPSNHAKFGETLAVLAGDALLAQAFIFPLERLTDLPAERILQAMRRFAKAIGPAGVCGGQVLDMFAEEGSDHPDYVRRIAELKTGALIEAAVTSGAALGTSESSIIEKYRRYAMHLGSAFQIVDDILDVTSTAAELGKTPGKDSEQNKLTHVSVYGLDGARTMAQLESDAAKKELEGLLPTDDFLMLLPDYLVHRSR